RSRVEHELTSMWKAKRLPDNLPALVDWTRTHLAPRHSEWIDARLKDARTPWFSTHPSEAARIARVEALQLPGIIRHDRPARTLFRHFDATCRTLTMVYYHDCLGFVVPAEQLMDASVVFGRQSRADDDFAELTSYLGYKPSSARMLVPDFSD